MVDRALPLSCVQRDASGRRAVPNTEHIAPAEPTTNPHDHDHLCARKIRTDTHHRDLRARIATKAAKVLHRQESVSIAMEHGSFADSTWKDTVPRENIAVQSTGKVTNAKELIYQTEPRRPYHNLNKAKLEDEVVAVPSAKGPERQATSDSLLPLAKT